MDLFQRTFKELRTASRSANESLWYGGIAGITVCSLFLGLLGSALGWWIGAIVSQTFLLVGSVFILVTLQEYEDKMMREPTEVQAQLNPALIANTAVRVLQIVQLLCTRSYAIALVLFVPAVVYDVAVGRRKVPRIDATRLWKDIGPLRDEFKIAVGLNVFLFIVCLVAMLYDIIANLF
jgi:dipeptide/tripeptide permease